jgi:hypothetical protein
MRCNNGYEPFSVLATNLFEAVKAYGRFALAFHVDDDAFPEEAWDRIQLTKAILELLEQKAGLVFDENEIPLCYNTLNWPITAPPGGYSGRNEPVRPTQIIDSLVTNWGMERQLDSAVTRLMRAALGVCHRQGLPAAIRYLVDLQRHGFVLKSLSL